MYTSNRFRDDCCAGHFGFGVTRFLARSGRPSGAWGRFPAGASLGRKRTAPTRT